MREDSGIGVLTTDRNLVVRTWNPWLAAATGKDEGAVCGRRLEEVAGDGDAGWDRAIFEEILETGSPRVFAPAFHRYMIRCAPPQPSAYFDTMQQRVTIAPLRQDADIVGLMVTIEDVTARLEQERDLTARLQREGATGDAVLAAVGAEDWRLRRAAVQTLRRSATPEDVGHLIQTLQRDHHDLNVLSSALQVLVAANLDVIPPLITLLADRDSNLRMHAALALGELRSAAAIPQLIDALADPDHNVRFHAIEALGKIGAAEAVDSLADTAASGDFFLAFAAIDALAKTDDPRVAPRLVRLLSEGELRPAIVDTLAAVGDEECVPPLVDLLNSSEADAASIAAALERIHARYEETSEAGAHIEDLVRAALMPAGVRHLAAAVERRAAPLKPLIAVLGWVGGDAVESLVGAMSEPDVQATLDGALMRIGRDAVAPLIAKLLEGTRQERLASAALLGRLGDRSAVTALTASLRSPDADLVSAAAGALAALGDPRALDDLLPLFAHPAGPVRQAAIAAVNSIGAAASAVKLRPKLTDPDPRVRECAIRVAGYFGFDECIAAIVSATDDDVEEVRRAAIEQLPVLDDPRALPKLVAALATDTPRNRAAAAHALRAVDDPASEAPLERALDDEDAWVRYFAAGSIARRRMTAAVPRLVQSATLDAPHVRIAALNALGTLGATEVVDLAAELMCDADPDLVAAAISALAEVRDPRADHLLNEAVRGTRVVCREPAAIALARRPTAGSVDALAWAAHLDEPAGLHSVAVDGLRRIAAAGAAEVRDRAIVALLDLAAEHRLRDDVLTALATAPESAVPAIAGALTHASRVAARLAAVEALTRMRYRGASEALTQALTDDDASVRAAAIDAFARLGTPAVAATIVRLAESDPDARVRRHAEAACRRHKWGTRTATP